MTRRNAIRLLGSFGAVTASIAAARPPVPRPEAKALEPIIACRTVQEPTARLACFDQQVGILANATAQHDVVVMDRQDVARARRSLFGFEMPTLDFLRGDRDKKGAPDEDRLVANARDAHQDREGYWIVTLDDGAVWRQTGGTIALPPRAGDRVELRRGALGSYFMRIGKQPGVRAKREG